jgi:3-hydroxybutyryl-CoA dehydrogenase
MSDVDAMDRKTIRKVGLVGCGLMGSGIAEVSARAGYVTVVRETSAELAAKGRDRVLKSLARGVEKGKLTGAVRDEAVARLSFTMALEELADCDIVIEAATENPKLKKELFAALDAACEPGALLASNTSSIPIIELAAVTRRPELVVGLHFFNPVPVMPLVEVVRSIRSSDASVTAARSFAESLGKRPIIAKDRAGFVVNVLLVPYMLEAVRLVENGVATAEDVDAGMKLGCGHPMGPLELLDFIGIDTTFYIAQILFEEFKDPHYAPPTLLKQMTIAGLHGRKSGRGFYSY